MVMKGLVHPEGTKHAPQQLYSTSPPEPYRPLLSSLERAAHSHLGNSTPSPDQSHKDATRQAAGSKEGSQCRHEGAYTGAATAKCQRYGQEGKGEKASFVASVWLRSNYRLRLLLPTSQSDAHLLM
eukprot:scaffold286132_cov16-Tisochrysis_lutea.AAC.1